MKFLKVAPIVCGLALLGAVMSPIVKADDYDKKTTVTFSGPVAIPPVHLQGWGVLPAGTYVFKLLNSSSNRHIVQIFNKDQNQIYATILAIPNYRLVAKDKTVITFNESVKGTPESLRAWFFPGANWGEEFVYPKAQAIELAKVTNLPVLQIAADVTPEVEKPDDPAVIAQLERVPIRAVRPSGEVVEVAQVIQPAPQARQAPTVIAQASPAQPVQVIAAPAKLPATGSSLPLVALCGLLALAGAFTVRSFTKSL
ncbi:MAG: hypothetical protein ABI811_00195 [Acidobacteriota bacterium]